LHVPFTAPDQPKVPPLHAWQSLLQTALQQTPSEQNVDRHMVHPAVLQSTVSLHVAPWALRSWHRPVTLSQ
jgi:hypothetical protein